MRLDIQAVLSPQFKARLNLTAAQKRAMAIAFDIKEKTIDTRAPW